MGHVTRYKKKKEKEEKKSSAKEDIATSLVEHLRRNIQIEGLHQHSKIIQIGLTSQE